MKQIIFLLMVFIMLPSVLAIPTNKITDNRVCLSNTTIQLNQTWLDSNGSTISLSQNVGCANGCNTSLNLCNPPMFILASIGFIFLLVLILLFNKFIK